MNLMADAEEHFKRALRVGQFCNVDLLLTFSTLIQIMDAVVFILFYDVYYTIMLKPL